MGPSNHCGGAGWLREASKSLYNVTSTFFNTVRLLPKDLSFEHGGAKVASFPGAIKPRYAHALRLGRRLSHLEN